MKTRRRTRLLLALATACVLAALAAGAAFVYSGVYNVAATRPHTAPMQWLMETVMRHSVRREAARLVVPPLTDPALVARGRALHDTHCVRCHGAPGVAPEDFALGLMPSPANLAYTAREWPPAELFWVAKFGLKMTGMPAWEFRLGDDDLWAIVAYLSTARESPAQYRWGARSPRPAGSPPASASSQPDAQRGKLAIHQYACATCHVIPGITGAQVTVGPTLAQIARRGLLAGMIPNTRDNMVRWLQAPQSIYPEGAMPDLGVSERDAHDIAAYLLTLK